MVVCPCSGSTLSGIATAASQNLIQRAADVHLKERRPLILVPRETPLSLIQIENMERFATPAERSCRRRPVSTMVQTVDDLVDFVVARIVDQLGIEHDLIKRWGSKATIGGRELFRFPWSGLSIAANLQLRTPNEVRKRLPTLV